MNAKKCDKCSAYFEPEYSHPFFLAIGRFGKNEYFDLCPDCMGELKKWLNHEAIMLCRHEAGEVKK